MLAGMVRYNQNLWTSSLLHIKETKGKSINGGDLILAKGTMNPPNPNNKNIINHNGIKLLFKRYPVVFFCIIINLKISKVKTKATIICEKTCNSIICIFTLNSHKDNPTKRELKNPTNMWKADLFSLFRNRPSVMTDKRNSTTPKLDITELLQKKVNFENVISITLRL